jgi:hypothetical protein
MSAYKNLYLFMSGGYIVFKTSRHLLHLPWRGFPAFG